MGLTRPRLNQLQDSDFKNSCRVAVDSNITLSGGTPATVDGVNLQVGDRVLVVAQTNSAQNGVYFVETLGSGSNGTWTRALDFNSNSNITSGIILNTTEGDTYSSKLWRLTTPDPITIGTTDLTFVANLQNSNIYVKDIAVSTSSTIVDSFTATGTTSVRWVISARDNSNSNFRTSTIDAVTNGTTINYNEHSVLQSSANDDVVNLAVVISNGNIVLSATGDSANCNVTIQRMTLGSNTTRGYVGANVLTGLTDLVYDLSPELGGTLGLNNNDITGTGNISLTGNITVTGTVMSNPTSTSVGTSATPVDQFQLSSFRGAKYVAVISNSGNHNIVEALVVHNGTTSTISVFGEVTTTSSLGDFSTDVSDGNVRLLYSGASSSNDVKIYATYIAS